MDFNTYQQQANELASKDFFPDAADRVLFETRTKSLSTLCKSFDTDKRALFYSDRAKYAPVRLASTPFPETVNVDALHALIGIITEVGELIEAYKSGDAINAAEELGDLGWYLALYSKALGVSMESIFDKNIQKLHARYKGKTFTSQEAHERDLEAERAILEQ
jgi:NTP pyrophosphatase (non-canonical NTP hydrolase)